MKLMKSLIAVALIGLVAGGCVTQPTRPAWVVESSLPFDEAAARTMMADGSGAIRGSALIRQSGGGVVTCAGQNVSLVPATAYARERIQALYGSSNRGYLSAAEIERRGMPSFPGEPIEYKALRKLAPCDAQGFFKFDRIADGTFFLVTQVMWKVGYSQQGGLLMQEVTVKNGEAKEIVMAP